MKIIEILPDKNQPRKYFAVEKMASLKDSIKKHGIITSLIVQKTEDKNKYLLVDGERRYRIATELGMKEVPVQIVEAKNDFNRLLEQFHIQEQHEGWAPTEKALAILEICKVSNKTVQEVCELLSIDNRTVRSYLAFAQLQNKNRFVESQVSLRNAELIQNMKGYIRKLKENVLEESFSKADEAKVEKVLVEKIKEKEIVNSGSYTRIKDSFRSNPKLIDKFTKNEFNIDENFVSSNAKGARALRNMVMNANYVISNGSLFLIEKSVALNDVDLSSLKRCVKVCQEVINLAE